MKRWISTSYAWFWFGPEVAHHNDKNRKFSEGVNDAHFYLPDRERMVQAVNDFVSQANELQMEVKGVIPLQGATAETYAHSAHQTNSSTFTNQSYGWGWGWGLGYGYGASYTGGFLVILQSEEMINSAEYQARIARNMAERNRRDEIVSLEAELDLAQGRVPGLAQAVDEAREAAARCAEIKTHKPMLGAVQYRCGKDKFATMTEAEAHRDAARQALELAEQRVAAMELEVTTLKKRMRRLKAE